MNKSFTHVGPDVHRRIDFDPPAPSWPTTPLENGCAAFLRLLSKMSIQPISFLEITLAYFIIYAMQVFSLLVFTTEAFLLLLEHLLLKVASPELKLVHDYLLGGCCP